MFFSNVTMFRFPGTVDFSEVEQLLPNCALKPVGALEMSSAGFISPFGRNESVLSHRIGNFLWLTVGTETRMLPGAVVNDKLAERIALIEEKEGRKPGGRERKRLKDDLLHELLPTAFVKKGRIDVFLDTAVGVAYVNTSSRKNGEFVMSSIRGLLGSFPAMPLNAEVAPRAVLTAWIAGEPMADLLSLGEECELKDPVEGGAVVRCRYQELRCDEIDKHLEAGKQVTKLALCFNDHLSFVLGEDLIVRKLKFLDGAMDRLEHIDEEGIRAELDARFALQTGELAELFTALQTAFKISSADADAPAPAKPQTALDAAPLTSPESIRMAGIEDAARRAEDAIGMGADDPLYAEAVKAVTDEGKAGISFVQHRLRIGYNRAARLVEAMEAAGVVSVPERNGDRIVLAASEGS